MQVRIGKGTVGGVAKFSIFGCCLIFTGRNEVVAKVIFLHLSVILFTGGLPQCMLGCHPLPRRPPGGRPPRRRHPCQGDPLPRRPPAKETPPPLPKRRPPAKETPPQKEVPPAKETPQHMVNEQPVCILLECILVPYFFCLASLQPHFAQHIISIPMQTETRNLSFRSWLYIF